MMDIEVLIEGLQSRARLKKPFIAPGEIWTGGMIRDELCADAATALSTLQAENEKLRAEMEQVKGERDAAIKDIWEAKWVSCKNRENCSFVSAVTGMPDCEGCDNWEWRGPVKED